MKTVVCNAEGKRVNIKKLVQVLSKQPYYQTLYQQSIKMLLLGGNIPGFTVKRIAIRAMNEENKELKEQGK